MVERLGEAIEAYFGEHATLAAAGVSALDRYAEAVAPFMSAYDLAEQLLHVNAEQAAAANDRGVGLGLSVARRIVGCRPAIGSRAESVAPGCRALIRA